jgi:hypothetical protein
MAFLLICSKPKRFLDSFGQGPRRLSWLVHVNVKRVPEPWFNIDATSLVEPATCTCTAAQHLRAESNKNTVSYESENVKIPRASLINSWLFFFRGVNVVFDDRLNKFQV